MNRSDPKQSVRELLEEAHPALIGLSHWIHANPEVGFEEHHASDWVNEWLQTAGFEVERGVADMPTALIGRFGPGPLHVAICVEYDALPEVGHACGHNIIAATGVGTGLALASVADELGLRVSVMGTPAEESGGGKLRFIDAGYFGDVHAAAMIHPWPTDEATPTIVAITQLDVTYRGHEAHAAGFPHLGRNAADALVIAQTAIGLLRQQLLPTDRVHGIVTKGGDAPNIIPALTTARFMVRAQDRRRLEDVTGLVRRCFEAGALATGTEVEIVEGTSYANMIHDADLAALYRHNAQQLGRVFDDTPGAPLSTDMGDVSHVVPSIHPLIRIESNGAVNHQREFTEACASPSADQAILDGALSLSWAVIDAAQDQVLRARLMGDAVVREAVAIAEVAEELDDQAELLDDLAGSVAATDPELAAQITAAADALGSRADELADLAGTRLDEAQELAEEALLDEVAGEVASDMEDIAASIDASGALLVEVEAYVAEEADTNPGASNEAVTDEPVPGAAASGWADGAEVGWQSEPEVATAGASSDELVASAATAAILADIWGVAEPAPDASTDAVATADAPWQDAVADVDETPDAEVSVTTVEATWEPTSDEPDDADEAEAEPLTDVPVTRVAVTWGSTHAEWERDFQIVARHAVWESQYAGALGETIVTEAATDWVDPQQWSGPEPSETVAEAGTEVALGSDPLAESRSEPPVAEAEGEAVAEVQPESGTFLAEAEEEAVAGSRPDVEPLEPLVAEAEGGDGSFEALTEVVLDVEPTAESEVEPEPIVAEAEAEAGVKAGAEIDPELEVESLVETTLVADDIWYSGAPDDELPSAELLTEEPVAVAASTDRSEAFQWIPAEDEDR